MEFCGDDEKASEREWQVLLCRGRGVWRCQLFLVGPVEGGVVGVDEEGLSPGPFLDGGAGCDVKRRSVTVVGRVSASRLLVDDIPKGQRGGRRREFPSV